MASSWMLLRLGSILLVLLLLDSCNGGEIPGAETVQMTATSLAHPFHYPLKNSPRAVVEIDVSIPNPPLDCFDQVGTAKPVVFFIIEQLIANLDGQAVWFPVGEAWEVTMKKNTPIIGKVNEWDIYEIETVYESNTNIRMKITTNCESPVAMQYSVVQMTIIGRYQVLIAGILLVLVYILIITEIIHRTLAAMLGAFSVLTVLTFLRERPPIAEVIAWIDEETIGLLMGMMIIIGIFSLTGFFEWGAVQAFKLSKGFVWRLLAILCLLTAVLSAFLDNVTTMLLVAPVSLRLSRVVDLPPAPLLLAEVFFCNIGGTGTMIGDPPNIILGSVLSEHIGFVDFIVNLGPGLIFAGPIAFLVVRFMFRNELEDKPCHDSIIAELNREYVIHDKKLFVKTCVVLSGVILMFFLEGVTHLEPAWVALSGAAILLLISTPQEIDHFLEKVEWSTLLFFAGLFIFVEGLKLMGLIRFIGDRVADMVLLAHPDNRLMVAIVIILWVSAFASAFIDNIPYTTTMIPVILQLTDDVDLNLPLLPLAWALSFGACLGGNGTLVGASANVVTCGIASQAGFPISFGKFMKAGMPVMIVTMAVVTGYMLLVFVWLGWGLGIDHEPIVN